MKRLALALVLVSGPAIAEGRTVSWYAAHESARIRILAICEDDPGALSRHPDCVNARLGEVKAVADRLEAQRRRPAGAVRQAPLPPAWFNQRPSVRSAVIGYCRNMNAEQRARYRHCESAEAAGRG